MSLHMLLQYFELASPMVLGLFMLFIIKFFAKQGQKDSEESDSDSDLFASETTDS